MPRSLIDAMVISFSPGHALDCLYSGEKKIMFLDNNLDGYSGRLFIHATRYEDEEDKRIGFDDIQSILACDRGVPQESINPEKEVPENSMVGYCTVKIEPYNSLLFESDYDYHRIVDTWEDWCKIRGWTPMTTVYSMEMTDFHALKSPIVSIRRDNPPTIGEIWQPSEPIELEAMKMCLEPDRHYKTPVDFMSRFDAWCEEFNYLD